MLLMAAMTNVQIVCFYFSFVLYQWRLIEENIYGFFLLLVVGKTHHVSSGEGDGGQDGLRSMSYTFSISFSH